MWIENLQLGLEEAEEPEIRLEYLLDWHLKTSNSASLTPLKPLTIDHKKLWKIIKEMGIPDHFTSLLSNLNVGQETIVRTLCGTTYEFRTGKVVQEVCVLSPCLFNFYEEYIMWNAWLDESQVGIKVARRNINNLGYSDDTTLMEESEEASKESLDGDERGKWKNEKLV